MDFAGGILSALQMLLYCMIDGDNTQLTGNIPKLILSCEALSINTIFVIQHYILYPVYRVVFANDDEDENRSLVIHASGIQYNSV